MGRATPAWTRPCTRTSRSRRPRCGAREGSRTRCPGAHRVVSNLKTWLRGTHHGVGADHLDHYLNEFAFRFNRRFYPMAGFATLLGLGATSPPTPIEQSLSPLADGAVGRRPGRSTGLTSGRFSIEFIERSSLGDILSRSGRLTAGHYILWCAEAIRISTWRRFEPPSNARLEMRSHLDFAQGPRRPSGLETRQL